ncbi:hypothetical protein CRYUN_Cryun21dG0023300 [Craigia yunnanensis]
MAAGRVTCLLILLLCATWISFAQASQGRIPDSNHKISSTVKGLLDGEHAVTSATNKNWLGGRKMVGLDREMKKLKDVKMSGTTVGGTSKFSSTNIKCGNNLGEQTVSHFSDESGFVAFNADYHGPMHHPPKNN